jgi:hypothetical protein
MGHKAKATEHEGQVGASSALSASRCPNKGTVPTPRFLSTCVSPRGMAITLSLLPSILSGLQLLTTVYNWLMQLFGESPSNSEVEHFLAKESKTGTTIHDSLVCFNLVDGPFNGPLGTNCQLHLITRIVSKSLPLLIRFIPSLGNPFLCCRNELPGERSVFSFSTKRQNRSALCPWPGQISPFLILF